MNGTEREWDWLNWDYLNVKTLISLILVDFVRELVCLAQCFIQVSTVPPDFIESSSGNLSGGTNMKPA